MINFTPQSGCSLWQYLQSLEFLRRKSSHTRTPPMFAETSLLEICELDPPSLSPGPSSCPAPKRAAENRGRLSLSVVSGCQAHGLFPQVAWKTPKTLTAADTHPSAVNFLRMNQLGRSEQGEIKTTLIIKSFPLLTHPNDGQRVLDKEVENQGDDADEG